MLTSTAQMRGRVIDYLEDLASTEDPQEQVAALSTLLQQEGTANELGELQRSASSHLGEGFSTIVGDIAAQGR